MDASYRTHCRLSTSSVLPTRPVTVLRMPATEFCEHCHYSVHFTLALLYNHIYLVIKTFQNVLECAGSCMRLVCQTGWRLDARRALQTLLPSVHSCAGNLCSSKEVCDPQSFTSQLHQDSGSCFCWMACWMDGHASRECSGV